MAEARVSLAQEQFKCPVCLELLKDPVTVPCGHSFCKVCINGYWDQVPVYSCPQCRETFTPRPVLRRNNMLAEVVDKLRMAAAEIEVQRSAQETGDYDYDSDYDDAELACIIFPSQPTRREDFLPYYCHLTLDLNTAHCNLILSENNRVVSWSRKKRYYPNHPERFDWWCQVLCKESVCGRCFWEVERSCEDSVSIAVSYKGISRKGCGNECGFGNNNQSWSLDCSSSSSLWHNNIKTEISSSPCSRIGVYVDHSAGTLSFYSVSDTMRLLHRVYTTFTQPLYAGIGFYDYGSSVRLCDAE